MRPSRHRRSRPARWRVFVAAVGIVVALLAPAAVARLAPSADQDAGGNERAARFRAQDVSAVLTPPRHGPDRLLGWMRAGYAREVEAREQRELARERREAARERREAARERREALRRAAARELREAARAARQAARERREAAAQSPIAVRVGSFNVLGSQHTDADGPRHNFPPASVRTAAAASLVAGHGVDILGTQELQADQLRGLQARTGLAAWPGFGWGEAETDNSILYDPGVFDYVSGSRFTIPFMDRPRPQPILRLRHRETGRELYVVNTHPSAGGGRYVTQRRTGQAVLVSVIRDLRATGLPVLVTGDMNDREEFYCRVVAPAGLSAPNGGSYGSGCQPPPQPLPVDWVVGAGATWQNYWRDTTPVTRRVSDHFFISATAMLTP